MDMEKKDGRVIIGKRETIVLRKMQPADKTFLLVDLSFKGKTAYGPNATNIIMEPLGDTGIVMCVNGEIAGIVDLSIIQGLVSPEVINADNKTISIVIHNFEIFNKFRHRNLATRLINYVSDGFGQANGLAPGYIVWVMADDHNRNFYIDLGYTKFAPYTLYNVSK